MNLPLVVNKKINNTKANIHILSNLYYKLVSQIYIINIYFNDNVDVTFNTLTKLFDCNYIKWRAIDIWSQIFCHNSLTIILHLVPLDVKRDRVSK